MLRIFKKMLLACGLVMTCLSGVEAARVTIDITKGVMKPISIALNAFDASGVLSKQFLEIIQNDLEGTFLFRSIPQKAFMQNPTSVAELPKFSLWKTINAQYLANIEINCTGGTLKVSLALYDVLSEIKVNLMNISGNVGNWRKIAHVIANKIYERVTGEAGYFDTKIMYVSVENTPKNGKTYRLALMDQDGYDHQFLTGGQTIVLTPRFAPNGKECSFFSYKEKIVNGRRIPISASVYRLDLQKRSAPKLIADFNGMSYAPRYSPDGNLLIFSLSSNGSSSIYTFNLTTKEVVRLTRGRCIDTSPCYSPDGKYIVFNSDRGGTQQLYIMDADGSNVRRLSFGHSKYATPVWSPRGDWIAFTKFGKGVFDIGIVRPDGTEERVLTSGYLTEGPSWSPNGRVIIFSHQDYAKREKIYSIDVTGYNKHEVTTPFNAIDPEWSRNLGVDN
ncbi:MAG: Tol-Pal system beta propeller repeat protein TolB [Holosporaceae bacterium]|jgi:TolB protein|nr:Tol-Pal system beta propeller repeat protein TolB [Holosporaceae bacterium]